MRVFPNEEKCGTMLSKLVNRDGPFSFRKFYEGSIRINQDPQRKLSLIIQKRPEPQKKQEFIY